MTIWSLIRYAILASLAFSAAASASRVKDLGTFEGVRSNQLVGYGIVVGLAGTGDDNLEYVTQGMNGVASRFGVTLPPGVNPALRNAAAVMVTADLPAFARPGQRIDITVSAIGRARSLRGGTLILSPLRGADGQIYAMAQGNVAVGGLGVSAADGSQTVVNVPSAGRIPGGASVERAVDTGLGTSPALTFVLSDADLTTAQLVAAAINQQFGAGTASAIDGVSVVIAAPPGANQRSAMMSRIENLTVAPADAPARVIVNARTGTVVINGAVEIGPAAVSHGRITVSISENPIVSQPAPFSRGETVVVPDSELTVEEESVPFMMIGRTASLSDIVRVINSIGAGPADIVAILEALKQAGALRAELVIL
ncbi:MAG: flagellar basal body P-ring protein FlgI [Sphingopyxis sp.]